MKRRALAAVLAAALLTIAGCGAAEPPQPTATPPSAAPAETETAAQDAAEPYVAVGRLPCGFTKAIVSSAEIRLAPTTDAELVDRELRDTLCEVIAACYTLEWDHEAGERDIKNWLLISFPVSEAFVTSLGWVSAYDAAAYTEANYLRITGPFTPAEGAQLYDAGGTPSWTLGSEHSYMLTGERDGGLVGVLGVSGGWSGWIRAEDIVYPEPEPAPETFGPELDTGHGLRLNRADASALGGFAEWDEADAAQGARFTERALLYADGPVSNVRVFELDYSGEYIAPSEGAELYSASELLPERPLAVTLPDNTERAEVGFAFTDAGGAEHKYSLMSSDDTWLTIEPLWAGQELSGLPDADTGQGLKLNYAMKSVAGEYEEVEIIEGFPNLTENVALAALTAEAQVMDLRVFAVEYTGQGPAEGETVFERPYYGPDSPLHVFGIPGPGSGSVSRGLAFEDVFGNEFRFLISASGEDGSITLEEF